VIVFPNCKINLGLRIVRKREDGFHDLETLFYPIYLHDGLEIVEAERDAFSTTGINIDTETGSNICIKASNLLKSDFPFIPVIKMHLHKTIPIGAGLGGGSADGAFTLLLLNKKFNLGLSEKDLISYALQLGSDCPFFLINKPCFATGRGEKLEPVVVDLSAYKIILVNPLIHINTGWAFTQLKPARTTVSVKEIIQHPVSNWKEALINDFEMPVFENHPQIAAIKDHLYNIGAVFAAMSGSGSTVFGIFAKDASPQFSFPHHYYIKEVNQLPIKDPSMSKDAVII
jgi:4-diphosphocytidyl-2-C-methyl-D-erythritol kinase